MARKRGQNEGSIFRRRDGRWCAILNLGWENGKRRRKHLYGATAAEVQEQLLKGRMDHARGLPVAMERQTVTQYLERWLEDSVRPSVRPLSWESYSQQVRLYLSPAFGRISLAKLNAQHVRAFIADRLKAGLSARTVKYSLVILKLALAQAPQGRTCHAQRCCRC